jgi:hypothetical protein
MSDFGLGLLEAPAALLPERWREHGEALADLDRLLPPPPPFSLFRLGLHRESPDQLARERLGQLSNPRRRAELVQQDRWVEQNGHRDRLTSIRRLDRQLMDEFRAALDAGRGRVETLDGRPLAAHWRDPRVVFRFDFDAVEIDGMQRGVRVFLTTPPAPAAAPRPQQPEPDAATAPPGGIGPGQQSTGTPKPKRGTPAEIAAAVRRYLEKGYLETALRPNQDNCVKAVQKEFPGATRKRIREAYGGAKSPSGRLRKTG